MIRVAAIAMIVAVWFWAIPDPGGSPYCEMVELWQETNGDAGWPDYRNNYDQECEQ